MAGCDLCIVVSSELALDWLLAMVVCTSLALTSASFIITHIGKKRETRTLLWRLTEAAYSFIMSGFIVIILYGLQTYSTDAATPLIMDWVTPISVLFAGGFFLLSVVAVLYAIGRIASVYEWKVEENPEPALLNRACERVRSRIAESRRRSSSRRDKQKK